MNLNKTKFKTKATKNSPFPRQPQRTQPRDLPHREVLAPMPPSGTPLAIAVKGVRFAMPIPEKRGVGPFVGREARRRKGMGGF